jgi:hypothetical protein
MIRDNLCNGESLDKMTKFLDGPYDSRDLEFGRPVMYLMFVELFG